MKLKKLFEHNLIELPSIQRIDGSLRYYETPTGERYPSVTTVLSNTADKSFLEVWKKRVGEAEAEKIKSRSAVRGTAVHRMCENLVLNRPNNINSEMPFNVNLYKQIERVLIENVDNIRLSEGQLFSHKFKIAGSVDLVADYKGKKSIIDFKTSMKPKKMEWIVDYFTQAALYAFMLWEMTGILHSNLVIIICLETENEAQVFETDAMSWLPQAKKRCAEFHQSLTNTNS